MKTIWKKKSIFLLALAVLLVSKLPRPYLRVAAEQEEISAEETVTEPLDVSSKVTEVKISYKSGDSWIEITETTKDIPADATLKISMTYAEHDVAEVIAHGRQLQYKCPDFLKNLRVEHNEIKDSESGIIGSYAADETNRRILLTFDETFLQQEQEGHHTLYGSFTFFAEADPEKIKDNSDQELTAGSVTVKLPFEKDSSARLGELKLEKTSGSFVTDGTGASYLEYTLKVTAGDTPMPEVKVTDQFKANRDYIESYVGVTGTSAPAGTDPTACPHEKGVQAGAGSVYLGAAITTENPIPEAAGSAYTAPGVLVWNVGNMAAHETRELVYRVRLKETYTGSWNKGEIRNQASSYAKGYPHESKETSFEPHANVTTKKTAGIYEPDDTGGGYYHLPGDAPCG